MSCSFDQSARSIESRCVVSSTKCPRPLGARYNMAKWTPTCYEYRQLQLDLQATFHWGECWGMKFNVDKCHVLHIRTSGKCGIHFYEMNQVFLSEVQSAKYLGVPLSNDMSWSPHISSIVHKAHQRLEFIRHNLRAPLLNTERSRIRA